MRRTPLRQAIVVALVALTGPPLAASAASTITSFTEAWAWQSADAPRPSNEWLAWKLGREYAFAQNFSMANRSAQSEKSLGFARKCAKALGISDPPPPTSDSDYVKDAEAMAKEIDAKYGEKTRIHFHVGIRLTFALFGAAVGTDVTAVRSFVAQLASFLKSSGIPTSVWSTPLKAIQAKPSEPDLKKLDQAIDDHLFRLPPVLPGNR